MAANTCKTCHFASDESNSPIDTDPAHQFNEPGGLCLSSAGDQLLVADTNNHRIVAIDLHSMVARPWKLDFNAEEVTDGPRPAGLIIQSHRSIIPFAGTARVNVQLTFAPDADFKFTAGAPQKWSVRFSRPSLWIGRDQPSSGNVDPTTGSVTIDIFQDAEQTDGGLMPKATFSFQLNLCSSSVCFQRSFAIEFNVIPGLLVGDEQSGKFGVRAVLQKDPSNVGLVYDIA